jgi:hypothetical protein
MRGKVCGQMSTLNVTVSSSQYWNDDTINKQYILSVIVAVDGRRRR